MWRNTPTRLQIGELPEVPTRLQLIPRMPHIVFARTAQLAPLVALLAACGGGSDAANKATADAEPLDPAVACAEVRPLPVAIAVLDYITTAEPKPLRFLNAATTDSALPQAAEIVVQDKGPTFYWLPQEKNQLQIREKLARDGEWATMLVVVREDSDNGDGTHTVRVGGSYIGKPHEGLVSPEKRYTVRCQAEPEAKWVLEPSAGGA